jgi:hypothetical protein
MAWTILPEVIDNFGAAQPGVTSAPTMRRAHRLHAGTPLPIQAV